MLRRRRTRHREEVEADLEILPLMNLFVVLIPMLLLSAVFLELSVIRMNLAEGDAPSLPPKEETLGLAIAIEDAQWIVKGRALARRVVERGAGPGETEPLDELHAVLTDIVARHPDARDVVIESRPRTRYDDIVAVMDVSRETGLVGISLAPASASAPASAGPGAGPSPGSNTNSR